MLFIAMEADLVQYIMLDFIALEKKPVLLTVQSTNKLYLQKSLIANTLKMLVYIAPMVSWKRFAGLALTNLNVLLRSFLH